MPKEHWYGIKTRTCAYCGKEFFVSSVSQWLYKKSIGKKSVIFCSYNCRENWIKEGEKKNAN